MSNVSVYDVEFPLLGISNAQELNSETNLV